MLHITNNSNLFRCKRILYYAVIPMCLAGQSNAADHKDWLPESVQIHGFLSQGLIHTSDNNFFGKTDDSLSTDFRELGINGSWSVFPNLQLAMQVVWRDAGKTDDSGLRIDYGLASYNVYSSETTLLTLRGGRVTTPLGFYNETRDVASTRPSILLPQSIYFDVNRNLALSADGGYLYGEHRTDYGDFSLNFGLIIPRMNDPDFKNVLTGTDPGRMEGDTSWIARLGYEWQSGRVRLAATYADFQGDYKPFANSVLMPGSWQFNPLILSAQYNAENWSLTGEYALRRAKLQDFGFPDVTFTGQSYYVQGTYRLTDSLEGIVRYDELIWDLEDRKGEKFSRATNFAIPAHARFAQDWTFGLRYEILPSLMLSAEYHRVNGTGWLSALENQQGTTQHWNMYLMMMSYNF
ncbi:MAG: hypothetical protein ACU83N_08665 [Gammaproteobacteria bacterium]